MLTITVGRNDEDYTTIQEALNAIPYNTEAEIIISEGIYREKLFSDKKSLSIRGEGNVTISWNDFGYDILDRNRKRGTFRSYTAFFSGEYLKLENLTIENTAGEGSKVGQGIALYLDTEKSLIKNVRLYGHQDTLFLSPLPDEEREKYGFYGPRYLLPRKRTTSLFNDCSIEGSIDFIFGGGDTLFDGCRIICNGNGYVTAPSGRKEWIGFIFNNCTFESALDGITSYLMRPWRKEGKASFLSCDIGSFITGSGLSAWPGLDSELDQCTYRLSCCNTVNQIDSRYITDESSIRNDISYILNELKHFLS